jgi:hypothetical protein
VVRFYLDRIYQPSPHILSTFVARWRRALPVPC